MRTIRDRLSESADGPRRYLWGATAAVSLDDLAAGTALGGRLPELAGRSVLVATHDPLAAAVALIELDGVAARVIVCTPDVPVRYLPAIVAKAGVTAVVSDLAAGGYEALGIPLTIGIGLDVRPATAAVADRETEWVLLTSGTTGAPKMVLHTLATLTAPISTVQSQATDIVWGTFYDIRRYGGMQILLRALLGRGSFVVSAAGEPAGDYLARLAAHGATHVSGTATHWRRALMSPCARAISPRYVRLSGEVADQGILTSLRSFFPDASVGHAFASTEAGVAFEVNDGREGFPASLIGASGEVEIRIVDGSLQIRSRRTALRYLEDQQSHISDADGWVDTGDMVERRGDRYYFLGRRTGVINVGGLKVYPEEVEAAINRHPAVRMSLVRPRRNPITGALVSADVVLNPEVPPARSGTDEAALRREILEVCRGTLAPHKVPATVRFVPSLDVAAAGKLARHDA